MKTLEYVVRKALGLPMRYRYMGQENLDLRISQLAGEVK